MAIREILTYPHPLLKKRSREVDQIDGGIKEIDSGYDRDHV